MTQAPIEESGIRGIASRHGYRVQRNGLALFNLRDDPGETTDLSARHPEVVRRLGAVAARARADLGDALPQTPGTNLRPCGDLKLLNPDRE
ncbi:MAG TPA: hypothetical protein VF590_27920 [Isosphaeraceae bacterium]|jgi:arylsulfatase